MSRSDDIDRNGSTAPAPLGLQLPSGLPGRAIAAAQEQPMLFSNRQEAGQRLAAELLRFRDRRPVVLALPRGGVPVGLEIAQALDAPLDVILVRKIGAPGLSELAVGAIVGGGKLDRIIDDRAVAELDVTQDYLDQEIARQAAEIDRRRALYLKGRPPVDVRKSAAIVVDDGIATGATMRAALLAVRRRRPSMLILAVPVAPPSAIEALRHDVDEVVCLATPEPFYAIGQFYRDFRQVSDDEVIALLRRAASAKPARRRPWRGRRARVARSGP